MGKCMVLSDKTQYANHLSCQKVMLGHFQCWEVSQSELATNIWGLTPTFSMGNFRNQLKQFKVHQIIFKINHLFNCSAITSMVYTTQKTRVVSTALLNRTVVQNQKGIRLTHNCARVLFLKIFRGKPYSTTVEGLQNGQFCNQLSVNEQVSSSKGLKHFNIAKAQPREPKTT